MGGLFFWYSEEGPGLAAAPPSPLLAVPTAHPPTASVPMLYDGPLLCSFNVAIKGLTIIRLNSYFVFKKTKPSVMETMREAPAEPPTALRKKRDRRTNRQTDGSWIASWRKSPAET